MANPRFRCSFLAHPHNSGGSTSNTVASLTMVSSPHRATRFSRVAWRRCSRQYATRTLNQEKRQPGADQSRRRAASTRSARFSSLSEVDANSLLMRSRTSRRSPVIVVGSPPNNTAGAT